jgi:acyl-CoA thioesterase
MVLYPGTEERVVDRPDAVAADGSPVMHLWIKLPETYDSVAANRALIAWCQPGFLIGLALRPHPEVDISQAHRTISTGVIAHTTHFHDPAPAGGWLLLVQDAAYAGRGRVFGSGSVFTQDGRLVSTFEQDSMARGVEGTLDPNRSM